MKNSDCHTLKMVGGVITKMVQAFLQVIQDVEKDYEQVCYESYLTLKVELIVKSVFDLNAKLNGFDDTHGKLI